MNDEAASPYEEPLPVGEVVRDCAVESHLVQPCLERARLAARVKELEGELLRERMRPEPDPKVEIASSTNTLPVVKADRKAYMKEYMREYQRKRRAAKKDTKFVCCPTLK